MDTLPLSPSSAPSQATARPSRAEAPAGDEAFLSLLAALLAPGPAPAQPPPAAGSAEPPADAVGPVPSLTGPDLPLPAQPPEAPAEAVAPTPEAAPAGSEGAEPIALPLPLAELPVTGEPALQAALRPPAPQPARAPAKVEAPSERGSAAGTRALHGEMAARHGPASDAAGSMADLAPTPAQAAQPAAPTAATTPQDGSLAPPAAGVASADSPLSPLPAPGRAVAEAAPPPHRAEPGGSVQAPPPVPLTPPQPLAGQVTARLVRHDGADGRRLTIELDPAELGPVEVSLRLDERGVVAAVFTVDRPETLQLLQRDARALADMLGSAGYALDPGSLGFSLRDDGQGRQGAWHEARAGGPPWAPPRGEAPSAERPGSHVLASRGFLDLRV